jgi:hypothetical protein
VKLAALIVAATSVALLGVASARADADASAVLDKTYVCSIDMKGGLYTLDPRAHAGTRLNRSWARLPYAGLRTGVFSGSTENMLAWITSGMPAKTTTIDQNADTFTVTTAGTVGVRRELCRPSGASVPLTSAGLRGGPAPPLGYEYECAAPRRVLVRIRAVLQSRAVLRGTELQALHAPVREAKLAARTLPGKSLSYAETRESGKAALYVARSCVLD